MVQMVKKDKKHLLTTSKLQYFGSPLRKKNFFLVSLQDIVAESGSSMSSIEICKKQMIKKSNDLSKCSQLYTISIL